MSAEQRRFVWRARLVALVMVLGLGVVGVRMVRLQVNQHEQLSRMAEQEYLRSIKIPARRGNIFDRDGAPLAIAVDVPSIYANPMQIDDPRIAARTLSKKLGVSVDKLYKRLASERLFVWLQRQVTPELAKEVKALGLAGVFTTNESRRYYPNREVAAHVLGFTGIDTHGLEGIEKRLDEVLAGEPQLLATLRDARGKRVFTTDIDPDHQSAGADVQLTLDLAVQHAAEVAVQSAVARSNAVSATAVVLEVESGDILAIAVEPHFNPNQPTKSPSKARRNRALADMYEPGSTMKPLVVAAALDAEAVKPDERIFCEEGAYAIGRHTIRDTHPHGWLNLDTIVQKSSNIGTAKIGAALGRERLAAYLKGFGFGKRTGVPFPGETSGMLRKPASWSEVGLATISFGHGVAVSTLQLAAAYRTLAAGGVYRAPRLVKSIEGPLGARVTDHKALHHPPDRRVVSEAAVNEVVRMMEAAVEPEGTGWRATIPGYQVAGKTGTAQKIDPVSGGYSNDRFIAAFAGFVPSGNPKVVIVVAVDEPQGKHTGGAIAAPVFAEIAGATMRHMGVIPAKQGVSSALQRARAVGRDDAVQEESVEPAPTAALKVAPGGVPSFHGMSAREAMEQFAQLSQSDAYTWGLDLDIEGSGRVVSQEPAAGAAGKSVKHIKLRLAMAPHAGGGAP